MKHYKITFTGRLRNAIGIFYEITDNVYAENEEQALIELYKKYEHITFVKVELLN